MKFMVTSCNINGIWMFLWWTYSHCMYHKPSLGDGHRRCFLVKSPIILGPEQRWRHKCRRGHWGRGCCRGCLQRPRVGGFFMIFWSHETSLMFRNVSKSILLKGEFSGWIYSMEAILDDLVMMFWLWMVHGFMQQAEKITLFSSACGMSSSVFQALSHLFKSLEKVENRMCQGFKMLQDTNSGKPAIWELYNLGIL